MKCELWSVDAMTGQHTGKTVAIILGGLGGVAFLVICLLFARSLVKKHEGIFIYKAIKKTGYFSFPQLIFTITSF